jgi:uncharacterized membrane protein YgcG
MLGACLLAMGPACGPSKADPDKFPVASTSYCIAEGMRIEARGGWRCIEALEVGDEVVAVDVATGERVLTEITQIRSARRECVQLQLSNGSALRCTPDHPLYDPETGHYAPASQWVEGRRSSLLGSDGTRVAVQATDAYAGVFDVFDLTVASEHHNFVAEGCVAHNKSPSCDDVPDFCTSDPSGPSSTATSSTTTGTSTGTEGSTGEATGSSTSTNGGTGSSGSSGTSGSTGGTGSTG